MEWIAQRQAEVSADLADFPAAKQSIIDGVVPHRDRLCMRMIEKQARIAVTKDLPTHESLAENPLHEVSFDAAPLITDEQSKFDAYVAAGDSDGLISRYPVRETGVLGSIADKLGFKSRAKYESAVRKLLTDNEDARALLKQKMSASKYCD